MAACARSSAREIARRAHLIFPVAYSVLSRSVYSPPALAFVLIVLAAGLSSCSADDVSESRPAKGGRFYGGIYRMNEVQDLRTLDPVRLNDAPSHHVVHQIYDLLVDFDSSLALQPELAERWEISPDAMTYTYHLRRGVLFHDSPAFPDGKGREMTAQDVKYCFDRILDFRTGSLGAQYFLRKVRGAQAYYDATSDSTGGTPIPADGVAGFRAVDKYTFVIELDVPFGAFKFYPALGFCYIYPREAVEHFGDNFFRNPVGTGAFVFEHWQPNVELRLKRNPNYWARDEHGNQLPFFDGISLSFIKLEESQLQEFKGGNLEEAYRIPSAFYENVVTPDGRLTPEYSQFRLHRIPALSTQFYGMLTTDPVFKDKRIRQAFNYAIDREKIIRYVLRGQAAGPAIHGLVPPAMRGYPAAEVKGYTYDIEKARELLADAGYPGGAGFPGVELQLNAGGGRNELVAQAVQEQLNTGLKIQVGMRQLEWAIHLDRIDNGQAGFYRLGWIADYPDAETFLNLLYGANVPPSGPSPINSTRYRNATFDTLFARAIRVVDDAQRNQIYREAEQVAIDDAPVLLIFHDLDYRLVQPWVRGYSSNSMDRRDFRAAWFDYDQSGNQTAERR
jgi:peptide/nickel transport system substrate-binding protein